MAADDVDFNTSVCYDDDDDDDADNNDDDDDGAQ